MKGLLRPCRHSLRPELRERWRAHLCGSCLALRDTDGQAARILTGYDLLLVPMLVEAQQGPLPRVGAGPCAFRGFRTASVIDPSSAAARAGAAVALGAGAAGLADKLADGDVPVVLRPAARRAAARLGAASALASQATGILTGAFDDAVAASAVLEAQPNASLEQLLAPAGRAVGASLAQAAALAGTPGNEGALRRLGDAFGRLVHLVDAVEDHDADVRAGRFNPLAATATPPAVARDLARELAATVQRELAEVHLVDGALVEALLGPVLRSCVERAVGHLGPEAAGVSRADGAVGIPAARDRRREASVVPALVGVAAVANLSMWGGGRRRGPRGYGGYGGGYGYGPSYGRRRGRGGCTCCDLIACDCCANCACDSCCGDEDTCCCCV